MATISQHFNIVSHPNATLSSPYIGDGRVGQLFVSVTKGHLIANHSNVHAGVLRSFPVILKKDEDGFTAIGSISSIYEFGSTPREAIKHYLAALVEELIWLQQNKADLSLSLREDLRRLESYVRIM